MMENEQHEKLLSVPGNVSARKYQCQELFRSSYHSFSISPCQMNSYYQEEFCLAEELHENIEFVTSLCKYRSRVAILRIVHLRQDHAALLQRTKSTFDNDHNLRFMLVKTSDVESSYEQTISYVCLWRTDAIRKDSLLRIALSISGGVDDNIRFCRPAIKAMNKTIRNSTHNPDALRAATAEKQRRLESGVLTKTEIAYAMMETSVFWDLVDKEMAMYERRPKLRELVLGTPRKIVFKKRHSQSYEDLEREVKFRKLSKNHRPMDKERLLQEAEQREKDKWNSFYREQRESQLAEIREQGLCD
jgi:hypothetical protein